MTDENSLKSKKYIENSPDVDDAYGNKDNVKNAKDINYDLKNSIKNKLKITIPNGIDGINYSNYIVTNQANVGKNTLTYSNNMTIAQKLDLLLTMKDNVRNQIIKNLKGGKNTDFYINGKEKIPFVAYWKMIVPVAQAVPAKKATHIKLTPSKSSLSWINDTTIKATLYNNSNATINGSLVSNFNGTHNTTNGSYTFTVKSGDTVGKKTCKVEYKGSSQYLACSNTVTINFTKDTPTLKALTGTSIYEGYHAEYQLLNSKKKPISGVNIQIKIGSGSWVNHKTNSKGIVSIKVNKKETIYYKFNGTSLYNSIASKSQSFTLKDNKKTTKCAGTMTQSPTSRTKPYQIWSDVYSDCTASNYLRCGHESTGYSNVNTLGSKSGTFHQPAVLIKSGWNLGVPKDAKIKSVHVKWSEKQTNGPSASTSYTSFINIKKVTLIISGATNYNNTINTNSGGKSNGGKWVDHNISLGTDFDPSKKISLKLKYGPNESTNTGTIYVKGPQIIVEYIPAEK